MKQMMLPLTMVFLVLSTACSSTSGTRYSRAGRSDQPEARPMNHRSLDSESLYQACLRERPEVNCRNRLGR